MPEPDRELDLFFERVVEGRVSRRELVKRLGAAGLTMSSAGTLLAACGGVKGTDKGGAAKKTATHPKVPIKELDFSNWPLYIDKKAVKNFEKAYPGSNVKYTEEINDNEEFFGKVRQQLQARRLAEPRPRGAHGLDGGALGERGRGSSRRTRRNIPNEKNLQPNLQHPKFDPNRNFTLPWQSGMSAIGYNPKKTGRKLNSIGDLFDPKFKGKVTMFSDPLDSAGLMVLLSGKKTEDAGDRRRAGRHPEDRPGEQEGPDPALHRATTTRPTSPTGTSGSPWPTRATCSSSSPTTRTSSSSSRTRARSCGRTT